MAASALLLLVSATPPPGAARPEVMMMTGLPLVWGERGPFDPQARPAAAYAELQQTFVFRPVDVLDAPTLERGRLLFLAQPHRLAPAELAELDRWVRDGGRALILTDPMLTWPSELPLGDIRRPPSIALLGPLLGHWGLRLEAPAEPGEVDGEWDGRRIRLDSPGRFRSSGPACVVASQGWTAECRLGRGRARLVADADLMRDSLWAPDGLERRTADNAAVIGEWLDSLAGTPRERPRLPSRDKRPVYLLLALLAAVGLAVLLRRHRRAR